MDDSDRAIAISYILVLGWTALWNAGPSVPLAYAIFFIILILALIWGWVALGE